MAFASVVGRRWGKKDDKQSHVDRFKNSRALFEKLEKENSAPDKPPTFKAGTAFGFKAKDVDFKSKSFERSQLGEPTSYSASAAQVRNTTRIINSLNKPQENGSKSDSSPTSMRNHVPRDRTLLSSSEDNHTAVPVTLNGASRSHDNGHGADPSELDFSEVFIEPKSEPAYNHRHIFNRKLSSDVLPRPYQPPTTEIRPVKRPTSSTRLDSAEHMNGEFTGDRLHPKATPPLEKSLSKDDIAASLAAADKYLHKINSGSSINQIPNDEPLPWRSSLPPLPNDDHQEKSTEEVETFNLPQKVTETEISDIVVEDDDNHETADDSVSYDNVADVLSQLKASGHIVRNQNTAQQYEDRTDSNIVSTSTSWTKDCQDGFESSTVSNGNTHRDELVDYDSVASSTHSVYLESKVDHHTYHNIGDFKRRLESNSDEEPYEPVAPPTPPSRRHPANLPLCEEVEPEPMSTEEADQLLSFK